MLFNYSMRLLYTDLPEQTVNNTLRTPMKELVGHQSVVISADWLNTGDQVITASWDRTAILFDAETGENVSILTGILFFLDI